MERSAAAKGSLFHDLPEPDYDFLDPTDNHHDDDDHLKKPATNKKSEAKYILGTLVVRVVAARDLQSSGLFRGTCNPYASVKFYGQTQRTTEVHDTLNPLWPRGETMFLDVSLPLSLVTFDDNNDTATTMVESPVLTVALFHATAAAAAAAAFPKKHQSGDSDEPYLGMSTLDVTPLLTGKVSTMDRWLPLTTGRQEKRGSSVRVVCEYEASDPPPRAGDLVRFTRFCHPRELHPAPAAETYRVSEVNDHDHMVVLVYRTREEDWWCSLVVHRFMLLCTERHHGAMDVCQEEITSVTERLSHSPMLRTVSQTMDRVPDEGIVSVGVHALQGGASVLGRWWNQGIDTAMNDIAYATNWDGRFNNNNNNDDDDDDNNTTEPTIKKKPPPVINQTTEASMEPLPGMPCCPIAGEPMADPVVAADGHTYERTAISRWLQTSDKSPLTGSLLPHKELVPNYMLLSSLQEKPKLEASETL